MTRKIVQKAVPRPASRTARTPSTKGTARAARAAERQLRRSSGKAQEAPAELGAPGSNGEGEAALDETAPQEAAVGPEMPDLEKNADSPPDAVAELEAVVGMTDDDEPPEKREAEEPSNFLAMYFRDMARLAVLRPQEEFESARKIEGLEVAVWARILSFAPIVDHVLKVCELTLENSIAEFKTMRQFVEASRKKPTRQAQERLERSVLKVSERLRTLDVDKRILDVVLHELKKIFRGLPGRVIDERVEFSTKSRAFKTYLREVAAAYNRAHGAKNEFVKANLRLVVSIARRFNYGRMPLADLIQEGNIGLIKAVERYDYRRGYRFSTYASWWIRHAISRALADKGRAVRLPVHMIDAYHRVAKSKRELSAKLGRQPTSDELAEVTGIPAPKIEKMRTFLLDQSFSLDKTVSDEDGRKFIDFIQDPNAENITTADLMVDQAMTTEVREQLAHLKPIEADILRQRFGLDTDKELTLKEIGEKYNLSRERIRQLQEQALTKMRRALQRKDLI
jgi:RNA polymerase primary sigma factor